MQKLATVFTLWISYFSIISNNRKGQIKEKFVDGWGHRSGYRSGCYANRLNGFQGISLTNKSSSLFSATVPNQRQTKVMIKKDRKGRRNGYVNRTDRRDVTERCRLYDDDLIREAASTSWQTRFSIACPNSIPYWQFLDLSYLIYKITATIVSLRKADAKDAVINLRHWFIRVMHIHSFQGESIKISISSRSFAFGWERTWNKRFRNFRHRSYKSDSGNGRKSQ